MGKASGPARFDEQSTGLDEQRRAPLKMMLWNVLLHDIAR
jgi:hypothetical protein